MQVRNMPDMWIVNSTLSLGFSTLNLYNSKLHLWRSALELNRSKIQLFNSTIVLLCDSTLPADALVNTDLPQVEELDRGAVLGETAKDASVLKSVVDIPLVEAEAA